MATRFRDQAVEFPGTTCHTVEIESASPVNYHDAIARADELTPQPIDAKLFLPTGVSKPACVIVVPGSLGVAPSHLAHAQTFTGLGFAALVLDPFGPRNVSSTVANQTQYSFAASAFDVLAAVKWLVADGRVDPSCIGAQGHSRGGSAVVTAATVCFAAPILNGAPPLAAILAAYPWVGHQFLSPGVGATRVRLIIGDRDEWCSAQQVQGYAQALRLTRADVALRLVEGAGHSFDRGTDVQDIADASVARGAPTAFIADNGALIHPLGSEPDPSLVDRDTMIYGIKAGYGVRGAKIGSNPGEAAIFEKDMRAFWTRCFRST